MTNSRLMTDLPTPPTKTACGVRIASAARSALLLWLLTKVPSKALSVLRCEIKTYLKTQRRTRQPWELFRLPDARRSRTRIEVYPSDRPTQSNPSHCRGRGFPREPNPHTIIRRGHVSACGALSYCAHRRAIDSCIRDMF